MGCDIHFRVEYYSPEETVGFDDNGNIVVVKSDECSWKPAERLAPNSDIKRFKELVANGRITQEQFDSYIEDEPLYTLNYEDRFYTGRHYQLFGKLSGVRDGSFDPLVGDGHPNFGKVPDDVSEEVLAELDPGDFDLHSFGWLTLKELLEADWSDLHQEGHFGNSRFGETLAAMQAVAIEKCGGNTEHVRAIWAYDS